MSTRPKPTLTRFLTAMAHSPDLLAAFHADPYGTGEQWGLTSEQVDLLLSGNLQAIQEAVQAELPAGASAQVGYWVTVSEDQQAASGRLPDWWIFF
jgi:hypothetical protein